MEANISVVSNCRNSKIQISATSESLKRHEVICVVTDKSFRHSKVEVTYKSNSFNKFEDVSAFAEHIIKSNEGKRFWLMVAEAYKKEIKKLQDRHWNTYDFFKYQAEELDSTQQELFSEYFKRNSDRFYEATRSSFSINALTQRIIDVLGGVCK
jgi:translation initiation factor 2B subunit (eIF-2B alpha/beta/delta family)